MYLQFLVISYAAFAFGMVCLIFSFYGEKSDNKKRRIGYIEGTKENVAYLELEQTFFRRVIELNVKKISKKLKNILPKKSDKKLVKKNKNASLERQLRLAGMYISAEEFGFIKISVMILFVFISGFSALILNMDLKIKVLIVLAGCMIGVIAPTLYLSQKSEATRQE
jgi:hypothetical protein